MNDLAPAASAPPPPILASQRPDGLLQADPSRGLTTAQAAQLLAQGGRNAIADVAQHPVWRALLKLWAPVPWMLEAAIALQIWLGKWPEAGVVALLLVFNAGLGLFQESRAQATLNALKSRLALVATVKRDGDWATLPASELVPGDVVKLSLGGVVAADVHLLSGSVLLDQSMLTGESVPAEAGARADAYAGGWCGGARRLRRSPPPASGPSSAAPRNWCAPRRWRARSRRRCCAWFATW
jgi:H+-transporting ATPase